MTDESWRVFCAIEFPPRVVQQATAHIERLRERFPNTSASWNRDGKFHLTLKFIGETPRPNVDRLTRAARRATENLSSFNLIVAGSGAFPKKGPPKVLWLGINDPSGHLAVLHNRLEEVCTEEGFEKEERPFHPHLTIARLRKPQGARELARAHKQYGFDAVKAAVTELLVIRSELSSSGSKCTTISRHVIRGLGVG